MSAAEEEFEAVARMLGMFPEASIVESADMGDYAIELAVRGFRVFPLRGKVPAIPNPHPWGTPERQTCKGECGRPGHGVLDATDDPQVVARWWAGTYKGANIGARVPESVMVVDVDPRSGGAESLAALVAEHGPLPETLTVESGRGDGGTHRYYRAPDARVTSRHLGDGIDLKTSAGYCVVPPSIHPDTGKPYRWLVEAPIAAPPEWLLELVVPRPKPVPVAADRPRSGLSVVGGGIADRYAAGETWRNIIGEHGWTCLDADGDADGARWLHPNATSSLSATVRHGCLFTYSPNTPFEETVAGDPRGTTKFRAYALLNHGGDMSAAARDLAGKGW